MTEIRIKSGSKVTIKVNGPATVSIDYPGTHEVAGNAAPNGLAEAVSLVAARLHGFPDPGLSGDVDADSVVSALACLARAFLVNLGTNDNGAAILRDLGELAARKGPS